MDLPRLLLRKLRLANPWRYKVPFLISVPYFVVALLHVPPQEAAVALGMSFCTIFGIAGFGYLTNDYADRAEDAKAGKQNVLIGMRPVYIVLLLVFFLGLAIGPWMVYFPVDRVSLALLGAEFLLFVLYSMPPFRLKERGILGVIADALYAHALPAFLAGYTFWLIGIELGRPYRVDLMPFWIVLAAWQFVVGIRNIVLHQIGDFEKDLQTGTLTFGVRVGKKTLVTIGETMMTAEFIGLNAWMISITMTVEGLWATAILLVQYPLYVVLVLVFRVSVWKIGLPRGLKNLTTFLLDEFYCHWIPVILLVLLSLQDPWFIPLFALHILLFPNAIVTWGRHTWDWLKWKIR